MKKFIVYILMSISLFSCSLLEKNLCRSYNSDENFIRVSAEASSTDAQLASEKSLFSAKREASILIDDYIVQKYNYKLFLEDPQYENKITIARKNILNNINIVCSRQIYKKGYYIHYIAIEISKNEIDSEIQKSLKENTK